MQALLLPLSVAAGGALGALLRYVLAGRIEHHFGNSFPYAILSINVLGSLLMGVLIAALAHYTPGSQTLRAFLAVGVLGGFTTFSSFSLDFVTLVERGDISAALLYVLLSVGLSLAAIFAGIAATKGILS